MIQRENYTVLINQEKKYFVGRYREGKILMCCFYSLFMCAFITVLGQGISKAGKYIARDGSEVKFTAEELGLTLPKDLTPLFDYVIRDVAVCGWVVLSGYCLNKYIRLQMDKPYFDANYLIFSGNVPGIQ
jgi:hypothetical protein